MECALANDLADAHAAAAAAIATVDEPPHSPLHVPLCGTVGGAAAPNRRLTHPPAWAVSVDASR